MRHSKYKFSLRKRMLVFILTTSFIIFTLGIGYISIRYKNKAVEDAKDLANSYAREYANKVKADMDAHFGISRSMASSLLACETIMGKNGEKTQFEILESTLRENPNYIASFLQWEIGDVDPNYRKDHGRRRYFSFRKYPLPEISGYVRKSDLGEIVSLKGLVDTASYDPENAYYWVRENHKEYITDPYFYSYSNIEEMPSMELEKPDAVLETTIIVPIVTDGKFRALAGVDIPLYHFRNIVRDIKPFENSQSFILAGNGALVAHSDITKLGLGIDSVLDTEAMPKDIDRMIRLGHIVSFQYKDNKMGEMYVMLSPIEISNTNTFWSFGITVPMDVIMAEAKQHFYFALMVGLAGIILLAIIINWISKNVTKPINTTTQVINDLAQGKIWQRKKIIISRDDEIGEMANSLNILIEGLNQTMKYADEIGKGNLEADYHLLSNDDLLGRALIEMRQRLKETSDEIQIKSNELEKLSMVAKSTDNAVVIMDKEGHIEWTNRAFKKMYGYTIEDIQTRFEGSIVNLSSNPNINTIFKDCCKLKSTAFYDSMIRSKDGEEIYAQTTITPVVDEDGNVIKLVAIDSDITNIKRAKDEITNQRNELERLNATKDKFFSILSHDLKNPFSSLYSMSELILQSFNDTDDDDKFMVLKKINNSAKHIYDLLEDLLLWSRSQRGLLEHNPIEFNLSKLIGENLNLNRVHAEKKGIELSSEIDDNIQVYGDREMINTVVRNLVNNAVKFTDKDGSIKVKCKKEDEGVTVSVIDSGIGISEEDVQKLFRVDVKTKNIGKSKEKGTGLGLVLCKEFIEQNGGKIWVESKLENGSKFSFTVPTQKVPVDTP